MKVSFRVLIRTNCRSVKGIKHGQFSNCNKSIKCKSGLKCVEVGSLKNKVKQYLFSIGKCGVVVSVNLPYSCWKINLQFINLNNEQPDNLKSY